MTRQGDRNFVKSARLGTAYGTDIKSLQRKSTIICSSHWDNRLLWRLTIRGCASWSSLTATWVSRNEILSEEKIHSLRSRRGWSRPSCITATSCSTRETCSTRTSPADRPCTAQWRSSGKIALEKTTCTCLCFIFYVDLFMFENKIVWHKSVCVLVCLVCVCTLRQVTEERMSQDNFNLNDFISFHCREMKWAIFSHHSVVHWRANAGLLLSYPIISLPLAYNTTNILISTIAHDNNNNNMTDTLK